MSETEQPREDVAEKKPRGRPPKSKNTDGETGQVTPQSSTSQTAAVQPAAAVGGDAAIQAKIASLTQELKAEKTAHAQTRSDLTDTKDELSLTKSEYAQLMSECDDLKAEHTDLTDEKTSLLDKLDGYAEANPQKDKQPVKPRVLVITDSGLVVVQNHLKSTLKTDFEFTEVDNLDDLENMIKCEENTTTLGDYRVVVLMVGTADLKVGTDSETAFAAMTRCLNALSEITNLCVLQIPLVKCPCKKTMGEFASFNHKISKIDQQDIQIVCSSKLGVIARSKLVEADGMTLSDFGGAKYAALITQELSIPDKTPVDTTPDISPDGSEQVKEFVVVKPEMMGLVIGYNAKTKNALSKQHGVRISSGKYTEHKGAKAIQGKTLDGLLIEGQRSKVIKTKVAIQTMIDTAGPKDADSPADQSKPDKNNNTQVKRKVQSSAPAVSGKKLKTTKM